jgi:hypothetical protein
MASAVARKAVSATLTSGLKRQVVERTAQVIHATFPQVSVAQQASRRYFAIFVTSVSVAGFMALLGINTLLAQDAFTLSNLKIEAKMVADQRDAVNRKIDARSAPEALAQSAIALGMKPSETPIFLNLAASPEVTRG